MKAAGLLVKFDERELLAKAIADPDPAKAAKFVSVLGLLADAKTNDLLTPLVTDPQQPLAIRAAAVGALGRNAPGQKWLLATRRAGQVAGGSASSPRPTCCFRRPMRRSAPRPASTCRCPPAAGGEPLPPVAELVKRSGDAARGKELFAGRRHLRQVPQGQGRRQGSRPGPLGDRQQALARRRCTCRSSIPAPA